MKTLTKTTELFDFKPGDWIAWSRGKKHRAHQFGHYDKLLSWDVIITRCGLIWHSEAIPATEVHQRSRKCSCGTSNSSVSDTNRTSITPESEHF